IDRMFLAHRVDQLRDEAGVDGPSPELLVALLRTLRGHHETGILRPTAPGGQRVTPAMLLVVGPALPVTMEEDDQRIAFAGLDLGRRQEAVRKLAALWIDEDVLLPEGLLGGRRFLLLPAGRRSPVREGQEDRNEHEPARDCLRG